jgi:hypothetical protein
MINTMMTTVMAIMERRSANHSWVICLTFNPAPADSMFGWEVFGEKEGKDYFFYFCLNLCRPGRIFGSCFCWS